MNHKQAPPATAVFPEECAQFIRAGECLLIVLSRPLRTDVQNKLTARPVVIRGTVHYQFTIAEGTKQRHENLTPDEAANRCIELFGSAYRECHLLTAQADWKIRIDKSGHMRRRKLPPSKQPTDAAASHNRQKQYLIPEGEVCPFLVEMGVMTPAGKVHAAKAHKFRQINRFLEFIDDVVDELPRGRPWNIIDFGCGKSYLTFAIHYLLTHVHGHEVRIVGLDRNAEIISHCSSVARKLNCAGLEFRASEIASFEWNEPVDLMVSLHACDTATDDALAQAIAWKAGVILAVPCCQHEIARLVDAPALSLLNRHGIVKERFATLATDSLRAQILEIFGYRTQILEFIELEHTAKNLLIRAVRRPDGFEPTPQLMHNYHELKQFLGLNELHIERQLNRLGLPKPAETRGLV
ncbi:MAG: SAM-dependent methyltransferase [Planctomycetaceae bacterium]